MKGIIKATGKAALRAAARKAADTATDPRRRQGNYQQESAPGIRLGSPQSINELGDKNRNGLGIIPIPDGPITPGQAGNFNPFSIPPSVSVEGVEVTKCWTIVTFQNHFGGFRYGTWSITYRNPDSECDPPDPLEPKPKPSPLGTPPGGNRGEFRGSGSYAYIFKLGYHFAETSVYLEPELAEIDFPNLLIYDNPPSSISFGWKYSRGGGSGYTASGITTFNLIRNLTAGYPVSPSWIQSDGSGAQGVNLLIHSGDGYSFKAHLYGRLSSTYWGRAVLGIVHFSSGKGATYNAERLEQIWEAAFDSVPEDKFILFGAAPQWANLKLTVGSLKSSSQSVGDPYVRGIHFECTNLFYGSSDGAMMEGTGEGGGLKENRGDENRGDDEMNDACCSELLLLMEEQDDKISRLLDLLDPEGAWPITVPGQMIQLDNEKAKPLQLKSYPELWTAQLATQNRLREVAAPPGAWPIKFPKGIVEPMGKGDLKIQSISGMLTAILRALDAKLGPIVNEVEIADGSPLEPGNQKMNLRFFGLSSIACQILQIAIDNGGDIDLSNNMLLRLAMTSAATQKAATQSALQTSEILDALGAKMNDKTEDVPFFFNPQAAAEVAENLQNTEESTESFMAAILDNSTQKIKYLSVDEKRNIVMRLTQMEQAINTIQAGQAVEWDGSKSGLAALMSSYILIDQVQNYRLRKELKNLDNLGDFGKWSKQHEAGYPEATATDEYSDTSKPWGRDTRNQPKIRKVDNNPDREQ